MGRSTAAHKRGQTERFNTGDIWTGDPLLDDAIARYLALTDEELRARSVHRNAERWWRDGTEGVRPARTRSEAPWAAPRARKAFEHTWTRQEVMEARNGR